MKIWFISGHLDITREEFREHYIPKIVEAHAAGDGFVVGDAPGCDAMAQEVLGAMVDAKYVIYHMFVAPRCNVNGHALLSGGFKSDEERDAAMTEGSDGDIAWVRPGKSKRNSGTAKNLLRREASMRKRALLERKDWPLFVVNEGYDTGEVLLSLKDPSDPETAHPELAIPIDPDVLRRYHEAEIAVREAERLYCENQRELRHMQLQAELFKEEEKKR